MKKDNNKGFTFIELVLYMGILAVFMVAVTNLMGSVSASNRKMTTRRKVQTMASETYESISDMFMSAVDVKIFGTAYISVTDSGSTTLKKVTGIFLIPGSDDTKNSDGTVELSTGGDSETITEYGSAVSYYDIADIVSFGDTESPSTDKKTYITTYGYDEDNDEEAGFMYIWIKCASGIDDSTGNTIYTSCTLTYRPDDNAIYLYRISSDDTDGNKFVNTDSVFCKYVSHFKLQVNPDEDSFAITLNLEDTDTAVSYDVNGVVSLRNSYVLKAHSWD